jgi:uncharacterized membrane protein (DUF4010 family)
MNRMDEFDLALRFGSALGLGVLLGLERERTKSREHSFAGVRTIGLIALAGALAAYFDALLGLPWLALSLFAAVAVLVVVSYAVTALRGELGITTEVTALLAFLLGWLCMREHIALAASLAVASALVLALKDWLHRLAQRIESRDVEATLKFAIVTLIILPLVPNEQFGPAPLDVLNPHQLWLMVVLISAVNFASYILVKVVGPEHGFGVTGLLGGLVSSTAVSLGFAQRSRQQPEHAPALALGILLAWTVMFVRVLVIVAIVNLALARQLLPVMGGLALVSLALCYGLWRRHARIPGTADVKAGENPFELWRAIQFGLAFGVVIFAARAAEVYLGETGLYLAGAVAGLTDVDAISLSMANLAKADATSLTAAAVTVVIATGANTLVKTGMALALGAAPLKRLVGGAALVLFVAGALLLALA